MEGGEGGRSEREGKVQKGIRRERSGRNRRDRKVRGLRRRLDGQVFVSCLTESESKGVTHEAPRSPILSSASSLRTVRIH